MKSKSKYSKMNRYTADAEACYYKYAAKLEGVQRLFAKALIQEDESDEALTYPQIG